MHSELKALNVERLVDRFVEIALAQDRALDMNDTSKYNRLFDQMTLVLEELQTRPGDQRQALLPLLDHPNAQVRLMAAERTLAIAPAAARQALQVMKDRREFPQAADASWALRTLDEKAGPKPAK